MLNHVAWQNDLKTKCTSTQENNLLLEKRAQVIKPSEKNPGTCIRALGERFGCGKTQIAYILKNEDFYSSIIALVVEFIQVSPVHQSMLR